MSNISASSDKVPAKVLVSIRGTFLWDEIFAAILAPNWAPFSLSLLFLRSVCAQNFDDRWRPPLRPPGTGSRTADSVPAKRIEWTCGCVYQWFV